MLTAIHPKLPMRDKNATRHYYIHQLGFKDIGRIDYEAYLMLAKDDVEIHFFLFKELNPLENYGQVYIRTDHIDALYETFLKNGVAIHPNDPLQIRPWRQKEFSLLDPDHNLLTFGQSI
jgi:catechol 2,3-dioxygenase-like lactoylglutathione lyase family enzyme